MTVDKVKKRSHDVSLKSHPTYPEMLRYYLQGRTLTLFMIRKCIPMQKSRL